MGNCVISKCVYNLNTFEKREFNVKRKIFFIFLTVMSFSTVNAQTLKQSWDATLDENFGTDRGPIKVGDKELTQAFCYVAKDGTVAGENIDTKVSIASVSKLFTTAWSLDSLGSDYKYETKIFIKDGIAHIEGSHDPVFGAAKIYWLLTELKKLKINVIKELTFHENFVFLPAVMKMASYEAKFTDADGITHVKYYSPTTKETAINLKRYLNTSEWSAEIKADHVAQNAVHDFIEKNLDLTVDSIAPSNENPFIIDGKYEAGTTIIKLKSTELHRIVKFMNAYSNNPIADLLFWGNGGKTAFDHYLETKFGAEMLNSVSFISGSGLPYQKIQDGKSLSRIKNQASCRSVLKILARLDQHQNNKVSETLTKIDAPSTAKGQSIATDFMPVSGSEGTIAKKADRVFVGKTGSLMDTSALAGSLSTDRGIRHFAILTQFRPGASYSYEDRKKVKVEIKASAGAKRVQSAMIKAFIAQFGENKISYSKPSWISKINFGGADSDDLVVEQN